MTKYTPPVQSKFGQIIDVIVLLVLAIGSLFVPLWLGLAGSSKLPNPVENATWENLGQNAVMVEKWNQLGFADAAAAHDIITARFDYSFSAMNLLIMIVVVVGYFVMMLKLSNKEYHDVIAEKFGARK
ncbi:MAG: hypothetical protein WBA91_02350 [Paracoccaceae bacterium]